MHPSTQLLKCKAGGKCHSHAQLTMKIAAQPTEIGCKKKEPKNSPPLCGAVQVRKEGFNAWDNERQA